jgi:hypothetical protein
MEVSLKCSKSPSLDPVPSQSTPSHSISLTSVLILFFHPRQCVLTGPFPSGFSTDILSISHFTYACCVPCHSYSSLSDWPRNIQCTLQIIKLIIMQFSPVSCHFIPLRSKYSLSTLFSNTLNLCSYLNRRYQVLQPYKTAGSVVALCVSVLTFPGSKTDILNRPAATVPWMYCL